MLVRTVDLSNKSDRKPVYINKNAYDFLSNSNLFGGEIILSNIGSVGNVFIYEPMYERASLAPNSIMVNMKESNRYYYYWFLSPVVNETLKIIGSDSVQTKFNKTQLRKFSVANPSKNEQHKIAAFLDITVSQIDSIIKKTKETIDDYKKYKQSSITEAVTKGLDPDAEMKDSGIEWIGEIPKHWVIMRLKNIAECFGGVTYSPLDVCDEDEGTLVLRSSNVQNGKLSFDDSVYIKSEIREKFMVKKGDILVCSRNGSRNLIGKNALLDDDYGYTFGAFMTIVRIIYSDFIHYFLNSEIFNAQSSLFLTSTVNQLTLGVFNNMKVAFPPVCEQVEIVSYLDKKTFEIDSLINQKQKLIEDMEAYKKSLIYECVTGKREVPEIH